MIKSKRFKKLPCKKCKGRSIFHIGDPITFGGNKTHHSHPEIKDIAENLGLFLTGSHKLQKAVILNLNNATKKHISDALKTGEVLMTPSEFLVEAKSICRGNLPRKQVNLSFDKAIRNGTRVYVRGLTVEQDKIIRQVLKNRRALFTRKRTKNVQAVIINENIFTRGISDFWKLRGVPVFTYNKVPK